LFERIPGTDNQLKALAVSGKAGKDGVMNVPLAGFPESGDYVIKVRREFPEGFASLTTQTLPFRLIVANWENAAGSYAALLSDANPAKNRPSDGASLRGAVDFTITKNGAISGRLQYNETHAHPALGSALAYKAVRRNFSGRFTPVSGEALKFVLKPKPALGGNPSGQEIIIEVDLSLSPPSVGVTVRDYASAGSSGSAGGFSSAAYGLTKTLTQAPESLSAAGAFILASDTLSTAQATDDRGYIIARVLPGANVLWLTRLPGYFGGGSAKLTENGALKSSVFYEARTVNSASTFSTTSLLGKLRLQPSNSGSRWMANLGSSEAAGRLEKQSTRIMLTGESRGYAGARSTTGVKALEFFDNGASESPTAKNLQPPLLPAGIPMQLSVKDPSVPSVESFVWNISLSSRGTPSVSGIPRAGQFPPRLSLRLNHDSGEWTGAYTSFNGSRRLLTGVVATSARNSALHSRGWVEDAATPTQTAGWELTFPPRL